MNTPLFDITEDGVLEAYHGREAHVCVPEGVRAIDRRVFAGDPYVESISLPDSIENVDESNFKDCPKLRFYEADGVRYLGNSRNPCLVLVGVDRPQVSLAVRDGCRLIMEKAAEEQTALSRVTLPDTLTHIGYMAFYGCTALCELSLSKSLTHVGACAFEDTALTAVHLPESVTHVGREAFSAATLREVTLPDGIRHIGRDAFTRNALTFTEDAEGYYLGSRQSPYLCFMRPKNDAASVLHVHDGCRFIYAGACMRMEALSEAVLPEGLTHVGEEAFRECPALVSISLPSTLSCIDECAFASCEALRSIELPTGELSVGCGAFMGCRSLEHITLTHARVGDNAFSDCESLRELTVREGCLLWGDYIFSGCTALRLATLPRSLEGRFTDEEFVDSEPIELRYV